MNCYLCNSESNSLIKNGVRDRKDINVLKCNDCGLVFLERKDHICSSFYEEGGMGKSLNLGKISAPTDEIDTNKRFDLYKETFENKSILDFGCGKGSLLKKIKESGITTKLFALEPEKKYKEFLSEEFTLFSAIQEIPDNSMDIITLFHVLEHIPEPLEILNQLYPKLADGGQVIIEVPSSTDVLLHLYDSKAFAEFSYWSCHLYLFNQSTLKILFEKTNFKIEEIKQYQRYTLANHLHWLAKGKPAGHIEWSFFDDEVIQAHYAKKLAEIGQCDSLIGVLKK